MISTYGWPLWATAEPTADEKAVRITVVHGVFSHTFELPRGDATSREARRIIYQVLDGLKEKERRLAAITTRITQR